VPQPNGVVERKNHTLLEMVRMMFDEHRTPRHFWAEAINIACYISNQIFMRSLFNLIPFELHFGHQLYVFHLRPFGCKCFILKHGNMDKFESPSSDGTPCTHGRSYRVLNLETNTVVESCDVTFNKTAPCTHDVFESAGDKEMEESIFVDEELQGVEGDEDEHIAPASSLSPRHVPASILEAEAPQAATSSSAGVQASRIEGEINSKNGAPSHIQKAHPPQQIIGNLNERVTRSSWSAHLSYFTNTLFVALFDPQDVEHTIFYSSWANAMHEELENFQSEKPSGFCLGLLV
jgi:hypothetical protein